MEKLAIFDIDYTLTKRETFIELYLYMLRKDLRLLRYIPRVMLSGILYGLKVYNETQTKETFSKFLCGIKENDMKILVKKFYDERLSKILYKDAIETIRKFKSEGYKIYLISASPEVYINEFYNIKEIDKIIGTRLRLENGVYRNFIEGENNKGKVKVKRLEEELKKENIEVDFKNSYMFSDSLSDSPLFDIVGNPYLINYKKKHDKIKILKWN